jgi:hypothetical protein
LSRARAEEVREDLAAAQSQAMEGARVRHDTAELAAGTYPIKIGLAPPGIKDPDITLAIQGEGPWYLLGTVKLTN